METEIIRDFCSHCQITATKGAISCNNCGSGDLIPNPYYEFGSEGDAIQHDVEALKHKGYEVITLENDPLRHIHEIEQENLARSLQPTKEELSDHELDRAGILSEEEVWARLDPSTREDMTMTEAKDTVEFMEDFVVDKEPKSKLQLDENAVNRLTTDKFGFLTGLAGTGKTTLIRELERMNPSLFTLCATTGIAAVNCESKTLHSTLKFFDTKSLENAWREQLLHMNLRKVRARTSNLLIDEASMLGAEQLDLIGNAVDDINQDGTGKELGLWLAGDLCLATGTKIMMFTGELKPIEDVKVGEFVMGPDSTSRKVLATCFGEDEMFKVKQTNADDYIVNSRHLISMKRGLDGQRKEEGKWLRYKKYGNGFDIPIKELMNKSSKFKEVFVGYKAGEIRLVERSVKIDPYFLGLWLGDGDSDQPRVTSEDAEIITYLKDFATSLEMKTTIGTWQRTKAVRVGITRTGTYVENKLRLKMICYNLFDNKHIPDDYMYNSVSNRLLLLAGLIDSDGSWDSNRYRITLTNKYLIFQIKQLADQLGFRTSINDNGKNVGDSDSWTVHISGCTSRIPCKVYHKRSNCNWHKHSELTSTLEIISVGRGTYAGIAVDGDSLFLLADGTVTHNCQLPPVKMKYVFKSDYWNRFGDNTVKLTKVWRQDNLEFMEGINLVRANKGLQAMEVFKKCGVTFLDKIDDNFEGTTLIPNNNDVDFYNEKRLRLIEGKVIRSQSKIKGKALREWEKLVPIELRLKKGAYIMILSNDIPDFNFVNGDCGWIEDYNEEEDFFFVKLKRTGEVVQIKRIKRQNFSDKEPEKYLFTPKFTPYIDYKTGDWVIGEISYHPLRLAYASTIHKSQGLSLDMVQINAKPPFFGYAAMGYVSISRARTPEGLFLVGNPDFIGRKITMNKEVMKYV